MSGVRVPRYLFRTASGWCWRPIDRLMILYGAHFKRDIFSVRDGYAKVWDCGPFSVKWVTGEPGPDNL